MTREREPSSSGTVARTTPHDVVVVDDDASTCAMIGALLAPRGLVVRTFTAAEPALEDILARPPSVVLLDLQMPDVSGTEIVARIRDSAAAHVAVIAITGVVDPDWRVVRLFDGYLRKPIDPRSLPDLVIQFAEMCTARTRTS